MSTPQTSSPLNQHPLAGHGAFVLHRTAADTIRREPFGVPRPHQDTPVGGQRHVVGLQGWLAD